MLEVILAYVFEGGYYGLISNGGRVITLPSYSEITTVGEDLSLCANELRYGILLNGKNVKN